MKLWQLFEAPIEDYRTVGDFSKNSSFRHPIDRKLITSPKMVERVKAQWAKTPVPFNLYFVNNPEANKQTEVGLVTVEWLERNMPKTMQEVQLGDQAINVLFTNNKGSERVPMTGWIMAHRLGHAFWRDVNWSKSQNRYSMEEANRSLIEYSTDILTNCYEQRVGPSSYGQLVDDNQFRWFFSAIGTMRTAREFKLRNSLEFLFELFAQYITTGKIKFNPLPKTYKNGRYTVSCQNENDLEYYSNNLEDLADTMVEQFTAVLDYSVGKTFVM